MSAGLRRIIPRVLAGVCGFALLPPVLMLQLLSAKMEANPYIFLSLFALGGPCGMLLLFARTGHRYWSSALAVPVLAIVQTSAVRLALAIFPHSRGHHIVMAVVASWSVVMLAYAARSAANRSMPTV